MLIVPELLATITTKDDSSFRYFPTPTPGKPNNAGVDVLGPIISEEEHYPDMPTEDEDLRITAQITPSFDLVDTVMLGNDCVVSG